jgi:hypothetical protein
MLSTSLMTPVLSTRSLPVVADSDGDAFTCHIPIRSFDQWWSNHCTAHASARAPIHTRERAADRRRRGGRRPGGGGGAVGWGTA